MKNILESDYDEEKRMDDNYRKGYKTVLTVIILSYLAIVLNLIGVIAIYKGDFIIIAMTILAAIIGIFFIQVLKKIAYAVLISRDIQIELYYDKKFGNNSEK